MPLMRIWIMLSRLVTYGYIFILTRCTKDGSSRGFSWLLSYSWIDCVSGSRSSFVSLRSIMPWPREMAETFCFLATKVVTTSPPSLFLIYVYVSLEVCSYILPILLSIFNHAA